LLVTTDGDEVTVHFDMHHVHLPWPDDHAGRDGRPAVLAEIEAWMHEEAVVAAILVDGKLRSSSRIHPDQIASYVEDPAGNSTLRVRSWHGRHDVEYRIRRSSILERLKIPVFDELLHPRRPRRDRRHPRRRAPSESYTAGLVADPARAAKKLGEEAVEAVIAAIQDDAGALKAEAADVLYHLLVVLHARGVPLQDVLDELERRTAQSGLAEKASRSPR
jgi:phosphoribosyl-ATP pyrophosphohydrolase